MDKIEFSSKEAEEAAKELHNQLLTELACNYLDEVLCRDYHRRFTMQAREFLDTPWERNLKAPHDICDALEKRGFLRVGKYDVLLKIVRGIDVRMEEFIQREIDKIMVICTQSMQEKSQENESKLQRKPTDKELAGLSRLIGFDFQLIGAELGVDSIKMQQIIMNHPNDSQTQIFQILIAWKQKKSREATVDKLLTVLKNRDVDFERVKIIFGITDDV